MTYSLTREQLDTVINNIRSVIQSYFRENNLSYAVFGKSEGLDSSVIAALLSNLEGVRPIGVLMPCESDLRVEGIGRKVLDHFNIPWVKVDLTAEYHSVMTRLYSADGVQDQLLQITEAYGDSATRERMAHRKARASGNIKARLRMITLYHIAQMTGGLVVSTDNLSEMWMGFWTLNGDVGDLSPIQYLWKGLEEYSVAKALGVPDESLNAVPTDGLDVIPGGTDEDQLGLPYDDLDRVIVRLLQNKFDGETAHSSDDLQFLARKIAGETGIGEKQIAEVASRMSNTHFKRHWPKVITREEAKLPAIDSMDVVS